MTGPLFSGRPRTMGCTIEIEHTADSLHAHVVLDDPDAVGPGDRVRVAGAPIQVPFGARLSLRRSATVVRAGLLARLWVRFASRFELRELYEVSFTGGKLT